MVRTPHAQLPGFQPDRAHTVLAARFLRAIVDKGWTLDQVVKAVDSQTFGTGTGRRKYGTHFESAMCGIHAFSPFGCALVIRLIGADPGLLYECMSNDLDEHWKCHDRIGHSGPCVLNHVGQLYMATAFVSMKVPPVVNADDLPGVVALDREPVVGDGLDELHESRSYHGNHPVKLRCTSYDRDLALKLVTDRYDQLMAQGNATKCPGLPHRGHVNSDQPCPYDN